jgi:hypothetical protein
LIACAQGEQIFLLRREKIRAVERKEGLALLNRFTGVVDVEIPNPTFQLEIDIRERRFVVADDADGAQGLLHRLARDRHGPHADQLLAARIDPGRPSWRRRRLDRLW